MAKVLILTGFMGAGKSAVGKIVARKLGARFTDLDDLIVSREGKSIALIFENQGETEFRRMETEALAEALATGPAVVAAGGGMLLKPENRKMIAGAVVVNLNATVETLLKRLAGTEDIRPLLAGGEGAVRALFEKRRETYRAVEFQVTTDGKTPGEVAEEVLGIYQAKGAGDC